MKEEEKYKKAFEVIKSLYNKTKLLSSGEAREITLTLEENFPELAESEDEKIRKAICELVKQSSEIIEKKNQKSMLAWLEKQCNQKPKELFEIPESGIENDVSVTSRIEHVPEQLKPIAKFILEYAHWNLHKDEWNHPVPEVPLFRVLDALVQEGKPYQGCDSCIDQKPVITPKFRVGDIIKYQDKQWTIIGIDVENHCYDLTDDECVDFDTADFDFELVEQKPVEWSEKDEKMLDTCVAAIHAADYYDLDDKNEMEKWLKSLKDRMKGE